MEERKGWREAFGLGFVSGGWEFCLTLMRMGLGAARAPVVKARKTIEGRMENFIVLSVLSKRFGACCKLRDESPRMDIDAIILIEVPSR